jgi:uncharacterized protein (DUF427 family)
MNDRNDHVRVEPLKQRLQVHLGGQPIVDTERAFVVHEKGLPPRYYVPREDVRAEIKKGKGEGQCPWKGNWHHLDVSNQGKTAANGAWTYFETTPVCAPIRDFIAFYAERMDAFHLGG